MAYTKRSLKNVEKEDFIMMVLKVKTKCDRLVELMGKHIDELPYKVDDLTSKFTVVKFSLVISKQVSSSFVQRETSLERQLNTQEQDTCREFLELVRILASVDNATLQNTVGDTVLDIGFTMWR